MIVLRNKSFIAIPEPGKTVDPTSSNPINPTAAVEQAVSGTQAQAQRVDKLAVEQMKNQRQQLQILNSKKIMNDKVEMQRIRQLTQLQRMEQQKAEQESKNQIRIAKNERGGEVNSAVRNVGLYKSKSRVLPTVGMPK